MRSRFLPSVSVDSEVDGAATLPMGRVSRRGFLHAVAGTAASIILPVSVGTADESTARYWFLDCETGDFLPVDDPAAWVLMNARRSLLAHARDRLLTLSSADRDRILRLVLRRCRLNLIEIRSGNVMIHYWGAHGAGDARPLFKALGLARADVNVNLIDRKRERLTVRSGEDFLFGEPLSREWDSQEHLWQRKWIAKYYFASDDWAAAPGTSSGYAWDRTPSDSIPWIALKNVWSNTNGPECPNCDTATCWINFGRPQTGFLSRSARFISICSICRRSLRDTSIESAEDVERWLLRNLDAEFLPRYDVFCGRRTEWMPTRA